MNYAQRRSKEDAVKNEQYYKQKRENFIEDL